MIGEGVDVLDPGTGTVRDDRLPMCAAGIRDRCAVDLEVRRAGVVDDVELIARMVQRVLDTILAGLDDAKVTQGVVGGQDTHLGGDRTAQLDDEVTAATSEPDPEEEPFVVL